MWCRRSVEHIEPANRCAFQVPNDDALRNGLGGAVDAAKAAACADAIRETRQKHEHELSALRSNYEAQLGALRSSCRPCANGPPASNPESGIALIP